MKEAFLLSLCPRCLHERTCCFLRKPAHKSNSSTCKTPDFSSLQNQPAITLCLGQQTLWWGNPPPPPQIKHTHTDQDIQTVQIHIWSVFVPILQSWKRGHSQDTPGTLLSKQASQRRRRSVIISTMTVWVYTKCHSGKRLLSGETASLFLCLTHLQYRSQCCCGLLPFS